jgi:hypothetical protein
MRIPAAVVGARTPVSYAASFKDFAQSHPALIMGEKVVYARDHGKEEQAWIAIKETKQPGGDPRWATEIWS